MNVRKGLLYAERTGFWSAGKRPVSDGDVPCLVVTDYDDATTYWLWCDRCSGSDATLGSPRVHPCCERATKCLAVPIGGAS